jgi:hypothetical protein
MDEDYQTDPTAAAATEWNSAWEYDIGGGSLPWTNAPNRKIMTPYLASFAGQNEKVEVNGHYLYANQRRSNPPQHSAGRTCCRTSYTRDSLGYGKALILSSKHDFFKF